MARRKFSSHQLRRTVANQQAQTAVLTWAPWAGNHLAIRVWLLLVTTQSHMSTLILLKRTLPINKTCTIKIPPFADRKARNQITTHVNNSNSRCGHHSLFSEQCPLTRFPLSNLYSSCTLSWDLGVYGGKGLYPVRFDPSPLMWHPKNSARKRDRVVCNFLSFVWFYTSFLCFQESDQRVTLVFIFLRVGKHALTVVLFLRSYYCRLHGSL